MQIGKVVYKDILVRLTVERSMQEQWNVVYCCVPYQVPTKTIEAPSMLMFNRW